MTEGQSDPLVAVIVATMDRPEYVREAVASACEQTYDPIEVVVVDGSETDRTAAVVEDLRRTYPDRSVTYIHNETPRGLPAARNQAVAATNAEFLAFLDDDDRWYREKTARQMSTFRDAPDDLALVHTGYVRRDDDGNHLSTATPDYDRPAYPQLLVKNVVATPSTVVVRRDPFESVGGFDESLRYCEDWDLYLRLTRRYRLDYCSEPLIDRTYHDGAMTEDLDTFFEYRRRLLKKHADELDRHGVTDRAWAFHHKLEGKKYLRTMRGSRARSAYRAALPREPSVDVVVLCALVHALPVGLAVPTIRRLGVLRRRVRAGLGAAPVPVPI